MGSLVPKSGKKSLSKSESAPCFTYTTHFLVLQFITHVIGTTREHVLRLLCEASCELHVHVLCITYYSHVTGWNRGRKLAPLFCMFEIPLSMLDNNRPNCCEDTDTDDGTRSPSSLADLFFLGNGC